MVLPQDDNDNPTEPVNEAVQTAPAPTRWTRYQNPSIVPEPEPAPEPEPDFAQQIVVAVNALRDARLTHDDAPTRQRKADTAVADVEVQRTLAMSEQQKAVEFAEQSRSDVLSAYDGLITAVQAARDAFRAGIMEYLYSYGVWLALLAVAISLVWWSRRR